MDRATKELNKQQADISKALDYTIRALNGGVWYLGLSKDVEIELLKARDALLNSQIITAKLIKDID